MATTTDVSEPNDLSKLFAPAINIFIPYSETWELGTPKGLPKLS